MYPQQCYRRGHKELFHVKPSDLFLAKNRQMATTQFSENGTFCRKFLVFEKTIRQKATENWFFGGWCHHMYAYWLQFSKFLQIDSPVKSKSA
jgi:hypothetical protein